MSGTFITFQKFYFARENFYCSSKIGKMPFYAVAKGRSTGIYHSWADCQAQVKDFSGAKFKKFDTASSANAFIQSNSYSNQGYTNRSSNSYQSRNNYSQKRSYATTSKHDTGITVSSWYHHYQSDSSDDGATFSKQPPQKRYKYDEKIDFKRDNEGYVQVYTDGACSANGSHDARAGLGIYWGDNHQLNRSQPVSGRATNNCGEIQAATLAIKTAHENGVKKLTINTDSRFLIKAATEWMTDWKQRGWKLASGEPVKNEVDFKELDKVKDKVQIKWNYVKAHNGEHGNEIADKLAKAGAAMYKSI